VSLQVSQLAIDYLIISENASKKIILTDSRQRSKERERSRTRRERKTFDQTSQRREEQSLRQSALRERKTLEQSSQRREEQALRQSALRDRETLEQRYQRRQDDALRHSSLRDRETTEEQLRRKELDAQRKTDIRERVAIEKMKGFLSTHNIARENSNVEQHYIGLMNEICHECQSISLKDIESFSDRAILCPKNDETNEINDQIVERLEGQSKTYLSIDTVESENDSDRIAYLE
jgi:hypothetical protein